MVRVLLQFYATVYDAKRGSAAMARSLITYSKVIK
jgi:hypothetical protein